MRKKDHVSGCILAFFVFMTICGVFGLVVEVLKLAALIKWVFG